MELTMGVFMLGWEFPPFISGGLGTACYGLTQAMSRRGTAITFVLPKAIGPQAPDDDRPVHLLAPESASAAKDQPNAPAPADPDRLDLPPASASVAGNPAQSDPHSPPTPAPRGDFANVTFRNVPALFTSPYPQATALAGAAESHGSKPGGFLTTTGYAPPIPSPPSTPPVPQSDPGPSAQGDAWGGGYAGDLVAEARRYAALCVDLARGEDFEVIHAHDWLTFPAGIAVAAVSGKPLVVHVHSTEFDRAGDRAQPAICEVERRGVHAAQRVIAVSRRTKRTLQDRYGVRPERIEVVYNGIETDPPRAIGHRGSATASPTPPAGGARSSAAPSVASSAQSSAGPPVGDIPAGDKVVLFLGRMTMQKGPQYFVAAAQKVLEKMDRVTFVMAGGGDMTQPITALVQAQGLGDKVIFPGFLRGQEVAAMYERADVFVMPSVSEPFGIAPLEAIHHEVPVIISKTSGAAEVLQHALKVDFWDVQEIANKVLAVLRHAPLGQTLGHHARRQARELTWDQAAESCLAVYQEAAAAMN